VFIEDDGEYDVSVCVEDEGVEYTDEGVYEEGEGVYEEEEEEGAVEEEEGAVEEEEGAVEDNVIGDGGLSDKKRVGYVSANNPSLHDNKIYCVVFHKTVHIIFFSFSSFIF
jgi:hypothetical protein